MAADCEKAWIHTGWEETMQKWYHWLEDMKKKDEKGKMEEMHQKKVEQMIKRAEGSAGLLHNITKPTPWRRGAQILEKKEEDVRLSYRCEAKRKEWSIHWQCNEEVQNMQDKLWRNEELRRWEEALPRLKVNWKRGSRKYKAKTGVGCDGFHPTVLLDLTKETRGGVVEFLEKVAQSGKWPQQACTTTFFLIPKNVTSERPIVLMPTLIRWWEAMRAPEVATWQLKYRVDRDVTDGRNGGAQRTVWEVLMEMERDNRNAKEEDQGAVASVLDLAKAVERVSLPVVWAWKEVAEMAKKVMKKLKEEVEKKGLTLSVTENGKEGKSKTIASCGFLENELRQFSREEGVTLADSVETLGVDLGTRVKRYLRTKVQMLGAKEKARRKKCRF